jgi:hypothetical protein
MGRSPRMSGEICTVVGIERLMAATVQISRAGRFRRAG